MQRTADQERGLSRWIVTSGAWILAGFLVITVSLILTGREGDNAFPSVTSTRASGYAAFAELLRRDGYHVSLDRSVKPKLQSNDVVVMTSYDYAIDAVPSNPFSDVPTLEENPYKSLINDHLKSGGRVIEVYNRDSLAGTRDLLERPHLAEWSADSDRSYSITVPYTDPIDPSIDLGVQPYVAWYVDGNPYASYYSVGDGLYLTITEGMLANNRFLDEKDNASFALELVHSVAKPGSRIVFLEAGIGNIDEASPTNTLGPWAEAARWQMVILFGVLVFTLGRRFGLPVVERRKVFGSRELFDAVADVFRRTGNTGLALDNVLSECESRVRKTLNMSPATPRKDVFSQVPAELKDQFFKVAEYASLGVRPQDAAREAARLTKLLDAFERDSRASRGLKR